MAKPLFVLHFHLSEDEFVRAHQLHLRKALLTGKNLILLTLAIGVASLQAEVLGPSNWSTRIFIALWLLVVGFGSFAYLVLPRRLYRRNESQAGTQTLSFEEDSVELTGNGPQRSIEWRDISRTAENDEFLLLYRGAHLPLLIAKKAFSSPDHYREFQSYLARKLLIRSNRST